MNRPLTLLSAAALTLSLSSCRVLSPGPTSGNDPALGARFTAAAQASGVTDLNLTPRRDGGLNLTGALGGNRFAVRVPPRWNGQGVLWAHGYVPPSAREKAPDPALDPSGLGKKQGVLSAAYAQGFAAADSAYAKTGYAVREGADATHALQSFLRKAGAERQYLTGASMGGNIVVSLIERFPTAYVGALSLCGVTPGWRSEMAYLLDFRVVYDALTAGTPYALPAVQDPTRPDPAFTQDAVNRAVGALFLDQFRGNAEARRIVNRVARVTGAARDPISFIVPLSISIVGLEDITKSLGGLGYSNARRAYIGSADDAALNRDVARFTASPESSAALDAGYTATGKFSTRLLSVHNLSDPLVPYRLQEEFAALVERAGNRANLVTQVVDARPVNLLSLRDSGPVHCDFSEAQLGSAWNDLRAWVERGVRPEEGKNITAAQ